MKASLKQQRNYFTDGENNIHYVDEKGITHNGLSEEEDEDSDYSEESTDYYRSRSGSSDSTPAAKPPQGRDTSIKSIKSTGTMERTKQDSPAITRIISLAACNLRYTKIEGYENEIPKWVMIKLVAEIRSFAAFPHLPNQLVTVIDEQSLRAIGNRCKGIRRKPEGKETAENAPYCAEDDDSTNKFLAY